MTIVRHENGTFTIKQVGLKKNLNFLVENLEHDIFDDEEIVEMTIKLKTIILPCPFCGSNKTELHETENEDANFVQCNDCNASGPIMKSKKLAVKSWNINSK